MKHVRGLTMLASAALLLTLASSPALASDTSKSKQELQYPNATRVAPKLDLTSDKEQKTLTEGLDAGANGDKAKAEQILQPLVDSSKSKYVQALALQGLATIKYNDGDTKGAIDLLQRSLAIGVMPNETYFTLEYELAQFYMAAEQYQKVLDTVENWRAQGKREWADSYGLEGNAYYHLQKYPEAIAAIKKADSLTDKPAANWNQILMASYSESGQSDQAAQVAMQNYTANTKDPDALNNAVVMLTQAKKNQEAIDLMEKARANGTLTSESNYVTLAKLYLIAGQSSDDPKPTALKASQVLEDGMSKGVVTSSTDNQMLLGQSYEIEGNNSKALDSYTKAASTASTGEAAVRAGELLLIDNKYSQAKGMLQQGIGKGVPHSGDAYMALAECEIGLKNKSAAIAALKQAEQQPETTDKAKARLKQVSSSK